MLPFHVQKRLQERKVGFSELLLEAIARECDEQDTAVLIKELDTPIFPDALDYYDCVQSNGELVILIVRNKKPITVMFRRKNQPFTPEALKVDAVKIW